MRKTLSIVLSLLMVLSIFAPVFAEENVTAENIAKDEEFIEFLKEQNIIEGDGQGKLNLDDNIDRASFAAILVRADGKDAVAKSVATLPSKFADMNAAHWANGYATVAHDNLWMKGNPANEFMPGKEISYAEIATTLVRFLGEEKDGMVYPTSYIAKATELGLFKGTEEIAGEYTKNAVRRNVFMMLYNALSRDDFGKYNVYKMIVLENNRVAQLGANEIKAEVLSVVQMANNVNERGVAKVGQQMVFDIKDVKVEGGIADTENLFGKVANFTVDGNGKLVKISVDNTYKYVWGYNTGLTDKTLSINGVKYNVRVDERYYRFDQTLRPDRDDRVYRTYLNENGNSKHPSAKARNFNYLELSKLVAEEKVGVELVRATIKDGMVLFVDAYNLSDIAPVQKVERDGADVYYYNDARNGAVDRLVLGGVARIIGFNEKDGFFNYDRKEIKAGDTIHWFDGLYVVRTDAPIKGKLVKTYLDSNGEYAVLEVEGEKDPVHVYLRTRQYEKPPMQAVFAYKEKIYRTLNSRAQLENMVGDQVTILRDVFGDNQLIDSGNALIQGLALIDRVISAKGVQLYAPNGADRFRLTDDWDSNYYNNGIWNFSQANRFDTFRQFDLAYVGGDAEGNVQVVANIKPYSYYKDHFEDARFEKDYFRYLTVGRTEYRYGDDTDVFVVNYTASGTPYFVKANMADVIARSKQSENLKAYVLSEAAFKHFLESESFLMPNTWGMFERPDYAKAIIFTNVDANLEEKYDIVRLAQVDLYSQTAVIETTPGVFETVKISPNSTYKLKDDLKGFYNTEDVYDIYKDLVTGREIKVGKYYAIKRVEGEVEEGKAREAYFIGKIKLTPFKLANDFRRDGYFDAYINGYDRKGQEVRYYVDKTTKEWGSSRLSTGFLFAGHKNYLNLIEFKDFSGNAVLVQDYTEPAKEIVTVTALGKGFIQTTNGQYLTADNTLLFGKNGLILKRGLELAPELKVGDVVEVESENGVATKVTLTHSVVGFPWNQEDTTEGKAQVNVKNEVLGKYEFEFTGKFKVGDRLTIDGKELVFNLDVDTDIADVVETLINANSELTAKYTVAANANRLTLTEKKATEVEPKVVLDNVETSNGRVNGKTGNEIEATVKTKSEKGVKAVTPVKQVVTLKLNEKAKASGKITVTFTDGKTDKDIAVEVQVEKGQGNTAAANIATALNKKLTAWTAVSNGRDVVITANTAADNNPNVKVAIID